MTVHTRTSRPDMSAEPVPATLGGTPSAPGSSAGRLGRITATSLGLGAVTAVAVPAFVLSGSAEHVITGSALMGLALGWALLAVLSTRLTVQPQRWAVVPAIAMAAAGTGLLLLAPDDHALTLTGWVWPPVMLALALWTGVQAHRHLHTRARAWVVYPAVGLLALASVGGAYQTYRVTADATANPMPGTSWDVGEYSLHLNCSGHGSPTVVLENGLGSTSSGWARITAQVSATNRVCAYDRAGQGWSGSAPEAHDARAVAADLRALLREADEPGPYVLAGHSSGGIYAMTYAAQYPDDVVGMVLLDAPNPYDTTAEDTATTVPAAAMGPLGLVPTLARMGIAQLTSTQFWTSLPEPHAGQIRASSTTVRSIRTQLEEVSRYPAAFSQAQALTTLGDTPLVVVTTSGNERAGGARFAAQQRFAALSTNSSLRIADTSHAGLLGDAHGAEHSTRAIQDVLRAVRTGDTVPDH